MVIKTPIQLYRPSSSRCIHRGLICQ